MIYLILILAFILRLVNINQSFWLDEAISALNTRDLTYTQIINQFLPFDNHPPFFYFSLKFWGEIFGFSDVVLRLLPVLVSVLTVYFVYLISKRFFEKRWQVFLPALLLAISPLHVYYSQELRMYTFITLFAVVTIHLFLRVLEKESFLNWVLFSVGIILLMGFDYVSVFLLPVFFIYSFIRKKSWKFLVNLILSFAPLLIIFLFWYPFFIKQVKSGTSFARTLPEWGKLVGGATFKNAALLWMKFILGRITFTNKLLYYGLIGVSSIPFIISFIKSFKPWKKFLVIWLWLVFPVISGFVFSFLIPAFSYFRFIYVLPAFYILTAAGIFGFNKKFQNLLIGLVLLVNIIGLFIYYIDPSQQRENWKQGINFVEKNIKENEIVLFTFPEPFDPYKWYAKNKSLGFGAADAVNSDPEKTRLKTSSILENKNGVYYFEYLQDLSDPNEVVLNTIKNSGFTEIEIYNQFNGIGEIRYFVKND